LKWFEHYAASLPVRGVIHLTTSASVSSDRIHTRGRSGEERIPLEYLNELDGQHSRWISSVALPVLKVNTEPGHSIDSAVASIRTWLKECFVDE
jgi:deoxyadenosine/deoxycytidine kinase